jgi:hypothetical protein
VQFVAPLLRVHVGGGAEQLRSLASLTSVQLDAAAAASASVLKTQLREVQKLLQTINQAQESLKEQLSNSKYQIRQMDVGTTDDFHNGLADRIGELCCRRRPPADSRAVLCRVAQFGL